jgi:hypothetical protein
MFRLMVCVHLEKREAASQTVKGNCTKQRRSETKAFSRRLIALSLSSALPVSGALDTQAGSTHRAYVTQSDETGKRIESRKEW